MKLCRFCCTNWKSWLESIVKYANYWLKFGCCVDWFFINLQIGRSETYQSESLHDIEVERYFTYGTIFLLNKATSTLQSLIQLLGMSCSFIAGRCSRKIKALSDYGSLLIRIDVTVTDNQSVIPWRPAGNFTKFLQSNYQSLPFQHVFRLIKQSICSEICWGNAKWLLIEKLNNWSMQHKLLQLQMFSIFFCFCFATCRQY